MCLDKQPLDEVQSKITKLTSIGITSDDDGQSINQIIMDYVDDVDQTCSVICEYGYPALDNQLN